MEDNMVAIKVVNTVASKEDHSMEVNSGGKVIWDMAGKGSLCLSKVMTKCFET